MHPYQFYMDLCAEALEAARPRIPADLFQQVDDYINRFDEWGLGMEMLIDQIAELEILISPEQFDLIRSAMDALGCGESNRLAHLKAHCVSPRPFDGPPPSEDDST